MKFIRDKLGERGISLLFTLGILTLCLMAAMALISVSTIESKNSSNYKAVQTARMAAQAGLDRAMLSVETYAKQPRKDINYIYSYDKNATLDTYYISGLGGNTGWLADTINGRGYTVIYPSSSSTPLDSPVWNYITTSNNGTDSAVIGRVAYRVINSTDKLNLLACVDSGENASDHSVNAASEASSTYSDPTSVDGSGVNVPGRPGRDASEIFLSTITPSSSASYPLPSSWSTYLQKMSSTHSSPPGEISDSFWTNWPVTDFATVFTALGVSSDDDQNFFGENFTVNSPADPEAFWCDDGDYIVAADTELYHRFNLARTDWNSVTVDSIISTSPARYTDCGTYDGSSIPWIANWNDVIDVGNFSPDTAWKYQIAANLIDYCSSNDSSTTDDQNNPTYVGNNKCPYINEALIKVQGQIDESDNGDGSSTYTCTMQNQAIDIELINMYGLSSQDIDIYLTISGHYQWAVGDILDSTVSFSFDNLKNTITTGTAEYPSTNPSTRFYQDISPSPSDNHITTSSGLSKRIHGFILHSLKIKINNNSNGNFYDYSYVLTTDTGPYTISSDGSAGMLYLDFQVNDPRQNLNSSDWVSTSNTDNIGYKNNVCSPNLRLNSMDPETNDDPSGISTAYIRKGPMKSPWELGFIHRGAAWQTLNLKKFDSSKNITTVLSSGGGAYSSGDANILDQVKMTSNTSAYGKVNLNSTLDTGVLQALFANITVGTDMDIPGSSGTNVSYGDSASIAYRLANFVKLFYPTESLGMLFSRAQVADTNATYPNSIFSDNSLGLSQTNDAQQEEIIGKFINLTKAVRPQNDINIIAAGQAVANNHDTDTSSGADSIILSTQKIVCTIERDPMYDTIRIKDYKFSQ